MVVSSWQKSCRCVCFVLVPNTQSNRIHFIPASRWVLKFQVVNVLVLGSSLAPSQALGVQSNVLEIDQYLAPLSLPHLTPSKRTGAGSEVPASSALTLAFLGFPVLWVVALSCDFLLCHLPFD